MADHPVPEVGLVFPLHFGHSEETFDQVFAAAVAGIRVLKLTNQSAPIGVTHEASGAAADPAADAARGRAALHCIAARNDNV